MHLPTSTASLLVRFKKNPSHIRHALRFSAVPMIEPTYFVDCGKAPNQPLQLTSDARG